MMRLLAAACLLGILTTGCAAGSQQSGDASAPPGTVASAMAASEAPAEEASAAVDAVLDHFITANLLLMQTGAGSVDEVLTRMEESQDAWAQAADALRAGVTGIPAETADAALDALDRTQTSMTAYIECMRASAGSGCEPEYDAAVEGQGALGTAMAALVPYGSRSADAFIAAFGGTDDTTGVEDETGSLASDVGAVTVSQSNALEKAVEYLNYSAFSRDGLIQQLEFEGFSTADATYGADAVGADWNAQAAAKAQEYLDYSAFSRSGLIEQLQFEGFTAAQAAYGASAVGL